MKAHPQPETRTIPAGEFKAKCLQLMDEVYTGKLTLIVTKRGKPVGRFIAPLPEERPFRSVVGRSPSIVIPPTEVWEKLSEENEREAEKSAEDLAHFLNLKPASKKKRKR